MDTYYQYRSVGVLIAHRLFKLNGWKVYGYKPDQSDLMTDYYDPAYWGGIAEKNGYVLCFNCSWPSEAKTVRNKVQKVVSLSAEIRKKIEKLEKMTTKNGASEQEEASAKASIQKLLNRENAAESETEAWEEYTIPAHQANPPRCNWHIEKDGTIIEKGTGLLKYSSLPDITFEREQQDWQDFNNLSKEDWMKKAMYESTSKRYALLEKFNAFISKIDSTCGGMVGDENDFYTYETVKEVKYKTEIQAVQTKTGSLKEGQCFKAVGYFTYGAHGHVYRIHEKNGRKYALKLNGKLTKECTGTANPANHWSIWNEARFMEWVQKGTIVWVELKEVKNPYEVEKVVKKKKSATSKAKKKEGKPREEAKHQGDLNVTFSIREDVDTRDQSKLWVVRIDQSLSREDYIKVNEFMRSIGGYYSRFKHGFIFREDVSAKLNIA